MGTYGRVITTGATTEICVFCHTPHHSNTSNGLMPLWNRGTQAPSAYTAYGTTIGGTTVSSNDIGSTTLACLSCHDGVTTFDNIANAPGKGGVTAGGSDRNWYFRMPLLGSAFESTSLDHFGAAACNTCHSGLNYPNNVTRLNIGTNLSNDHPVSIGYSQNVASLRPTNTTINAIDLTGDLASSPRHILTATSPRTDGPQRGSSRIQPP